MDILSNWGTDLYHAKEPIIHSDSDYESDPPGDTATSEHDTPHDTLRQVPETEVLEDNTYPVAAEQGDYPGAGNPLERLQSVRKNSGICVRTHGLLLLLYKVSNLDLDLLRAKSQRRD